VQTLQRYSGVNIMENIEDVHCIAAIEAVLCANIELMNITVREALLKVNYGKGDTLGLDTTPEKAIEISLQRFDAESALITEEIGAVGGPLAAPSLEVNRPAFYLSDPTDRSAQFYKFLEAEDLQKKVGDLMNKPEYLKKWAANFGLPPSITGASSAIT